MLHRRFTRLAIPAAAGAMLLTLTPDCPASDGRPCRQPHRLTRSVRSASHVHDQQRLRSREPVLPGPWHATAASASPATGPIRAGRSPRTMCDGASSNREGSIRSSGTTTDRTAKARTSIRQASGGPRSACCSHAGSSELASTCRMAQSSSSTTVDDPYGCGAPPTSVSMYRRPLPVNQSPIPQRGHVGWPRIVADNHGPSGPGATGRRRDDRTRAGGPTPDRSGETGDRRRSRRRCSPRRR